MLNNCKNNKSKCNHTKNQVTLDCNPCKKPCGCDKHQHCNNHSCTCTCNYICDCHFNKDMREIYEYLGKYVYNLLRDLKLPCDHPSLVCSLQKLADGGCLPCGHPSLDQLIVMAIMQEKKENKCDCNHWVKYK